MWEGVDKSRLDSAHYSVMRKVQGYSGMEALRTMFPEGAADDLNMVLFSTSGVHGTYNTIEEAEQHLTAPTDETCGGVTFLVLHPRLVALRYGCCDPKTQADIDYLKRLRASSHAQLAKIGTDAA